MFLNILNLSLHYVLFFQTPERKKEIGMRQNTDLLMYCHQGSPPEWMRVPFEKNVQKAMLVPPLIFEV